MGLAVFPLADIPVAVIKGVLMHPFFPLVGIDLFRVILQGHAFTSGPFPLKSLSALIGIHALSVHHAVVPLASIGIAVLIDHGPLAVYGVIFPFATVNIAVGKTIRAVSMHFIVFPFSVIPVAGPSGFLTDSKGSLAVPFPFVPVPGIDITVGVIHGALAMGAAIFPCACVAVA